MSKKWNKNIIRIGIVFTVCTCICMTFNIIIGEWKSIFAGFGRLISAMTPIIIGVVIAFLLNPIMVGFQRGFAWFFSKKLKKKDYKQAYDDSKVVSVALTVVAFLGLLTLFFYLVIPRVYESLQDLVGNFQGYIDSARNTIQKLFSKNDILEEKLYSLADYAENNVLDYLQRFLMPNLDTIFNKVTSGVMLGVKSVMNFLIGIIVAIYALISKEKFIAQGKKIVYRIFNRRRGNTIIDGFRCANDIFSGFINGKILDSFIIGIICYIFTAAVGMKYAVLISVIVGITNIIPFFGPFIGAVPGTLLALMDDPIMAVIFIVWILVLQQFDGNILGPIILGDSTGISGLWVLFAILVGGNLFGVMGMIFGVPVFACIYTAITIWLRNGLKQKKLSPRTNDYELLQYIDPYTGKYVYRDIEEKQERGVKKKKKNEVAKKIKPLEVAEADTKISSTKKSNELLNEAGSALAAMLEEDDDESESKGIDEHTNAETSETKED